MLKRILLWTGIGIAISVAVIGTYLYMGYKSDPYFDKVEKLRLTGFTKDKISISCDLICVNPNDIEVHVSNSEFDIYANEVYVSNSKQRYGFDVNAKGNFSVPLHVYFEPKKIFRPAELIGAAFSGFKKKRIDLHYKGFIEVEIAGQAFQIDVEFDDWLDIQPTN